MDIFCLDTIELKDIKSDFSPYLSDIRGSKVQYIMDDDSRVQSIGVELALCCAVKYMDKGASFPISYHYDKSGKPVLNCYSGYHISFSHTSGMSVVAIGRNPLGVDVECRKEINPKYAEKMLTGVELSEYHLLNNEEKSRFLLDSFVKKESFVKATGEGFTTFPCKVFIAEQAESSIFSIKDDKYVLGVTSFADEPVTVHMLCMQEVLKMLA